MNTIDLTSPGVFSPEDWIEKGKKYPGSPNHVEAASAAKAILIDLLKLLSDPDMPIPSFIKCDLPMQLTGPTSLSFSPLSTAIGILPKCQQHPLIKCRLQDFQRTKGGI